MSRRVTRPKGWPDDLLYLSQPSYSRTLGIEVLSLLHQKPDNVIPINPLAPTASNVKITPINDTAHPARGQHGLFAAQNLPPDTLILFYIGFVHSSEDTDPSSDYDLSLDRELQVGVDATKMGNEARFINDYRGVSHVEAPNAEFREVWVDLGRGKTEKRMAVYVLSAGKSGKRAKGITKGSEILVSYGKGFWHERQNSSQP